MKPVGTKRHPGIPWGLALFTLFWSALTLAALSASLSGTIRQLGTYRYWATPGEVSECAVVNQGKTDNFRIRYRYSANGTAYEGTGLRFGGGSGESGDWAVRTKSRYPVGSLVEVLYDPSSPARSVLVRGIEGVDLFALQFLTPFVLVMLALWREIGRRFRRRARRAESVPEALAAVRGELIRPAVNQPVEAALTVLGMAAFLGCFPVIFAVGFHPLLGVALGLWGLLLASGDAGGRLAARAKCPDWQQAKLDYERRVLLLPPRPSMERAKDEVAIAFSDIKAVAVISRNASGPDTGDGPIFLRIQTFQSVAHELGEWPVREDVEAVARLLADEAGITTTGGAGASVMVSA